MVVTENALREHIGWLSVARDMLSGAKAAITRFPAPMAFLLAAALQANLLVAEVDFLDTLAATGNGELWVLAFATGAVAAAAATLFGEAHGFGALHRGLAGLATGIAAAAAVAFDDMFLTHPMLVAGILGFAPVLPFIGRGGSEAFWMFLLRAAFAALLGLLVLVLVAGGISAILASLAYLFGIAVPDDLYSHVWLSSGLFVAPLFALGQLPERLDEQPAQGVRGAMELGMRTLGDLVAAPLLIVYAFILHAYALKIVLTGDVPQGQIGWLVLAYGFCMFGAIIVIHPFFDRARAPTRLFLRMWPFFLPVPLVLLFSALWLRIDAFGVTPERFLLGLFGLVSAVVVVLQLVPRLRGDIRLIAALPALALIIGSGGPYGAVGLSVKSQRDRFLELVDTRPLDSKSQREALSALHFLADHQALEEVAPEGVNAVDDPGAAFPAVAEAWGLDPQAYHPDASGAFIYDSRESHARAIGEYDTAIWNLNLFHNESEPQTVQLPSGGAISFAVVAEGLRVSSSGRSVLFAVTDILGKLSSDQPQAALEADGVMIKLLPDFVHAEQVEPPQLIQFTGSILLRESDWR